jgi:hypothetical protein
MRINKKYLLLGFVFGVILWLIVFAKLAPNAGNIGHVNVSVINTYATNLNSSKIEFGGSVTGFNTTSNNIYLETFSINVGSGFPSENFTSIQTNTTGFNVISISPILPIKVNGGQSQQFTLQIKTPSTNYSGALSILEYYWAPKPKYVNVTQVNFFIDNTSSNRTIFTIALYGFNASAGSNYLYSFSITNGSSITLLSFVANTSGFKVLNVTPSLPLKPTSNRQSFSLKISVPNYTYSGPISIIERYK